MGSAATALPLTSGLGFKPQHFEEIQATWPGVGFFEVHAENYMVAGGPMHHQLEQLRENYAISMHGVGLSLGGAAPLDKVHLERLGTLIRRYEPAEFSEHLAWSGHGGLHFGDLLPLPWNDESLQRVCQNIDQAQNHLRRRLLLENPATYLAFESSTLAEAQFLTEVLCRTGCGLLLDVSNAYVSAINHGHSALDYLESLPLHAVGELHLAGFARDLGSAQVPLLIDDHGAAIDEAVWALYRKIVERLGPTPTLIEWDNNIPPFATLLAEANRAREFMLKAGLIASEPA
jgi:hypothetical protein